MLFAVNFRRYTNGRFTDHHSGASQWINSLRKHRTLIHKVTAPGSRAHWCDLGHAAPSSTAESRAELWSSLHLLPVCQTQRSDAKDVWITVKATEQRLYSSWTLEFKYLYTVYTLMLQRHLHFHKSCFLFQTYFNCQVCFCRLVTCILYFILLTLYLSLLFICTVLFQSSLFILN